MSPRCSASVDGPEHARAQRDLDRVLVPVSWREAVASDREHELLARRVQAAGGAVEAVEDDPLDGRVDAACAAGVAARTGSRSSARARSSAPLPSSTATSARPLASSATRIQSAGVSRPVTTTILRRKSDGHQQRPAAANSGADEEGRARGARDRRPRSRPSSRSRAAASAGVGARAVRVERLREVGRLPSCALGERAAEVERDRHLLVEADRGVEQDGRRLEHRPVAGRGTFEARSGAIAASASDEPEVPRADRERPAARQAEPGSSAASERTGHGEPEPGAAERERPDRERDARGRQQRERRRARPRAAPRRRRPRRGAAAAGRAAGRRAPRRQHADDRRARDRRVAPDADHEQDGEEERADERAEQRGRGTRSPAACGASDGRQPSSATAADVRARTRRGAPSAATGACATKIARQSKACVRTPPSAGPSASAERPGERPDRPSAPSRRARRAPAARRRAAARRRRPARSGRAIRNPRLFASAHAIDAARKSDEPAGRARRRRGSGARGTRARAP